jgi:hypothetical protein
MLHTPKSRDHVQEDSMMKTKWAAILAAGLMAASCVSLGQNSSNTKQKSNTKEVKDAAKTTGKDTKEGAKSVAKDTSSLAKKTGTTAKSAAKETRTTAKKVGSDIKDGVKDIGHKIKGDDKTADKSADTPKK